MSGRRNFGYAVVLLLFLSPSVNAKVLPIAPISQNASSWCWLAVGQMIFEYLDVPSLNPPGYYQCGIAAVVFGGPCSYNCQLCNLGSGTTQRLRDMLVYYPNVVQQASSLQTPLVNAQALNHALSADAVATEIDEGRPIVAGVSPHLASLPPGLSEHAILIVGYEDTGSAFWIIVNDPFPYQAVGMQDMYTPVGGYLLTAGRYAIPMAQLIHALNWKNSVWRIGSK